MTPWTGYVCPRCGTASQHTETWQFKCRNCEHLVDPTTAIRVISADKPLQRKHCPFGGRCREDCQWLMLNGMCAVKKLAVIIDRMAERRL